MKFTDKNPKWNKTLIKLAIPIIFLLLNLAIIGDFGFSWDEPLHWKYGKVLYNFLFEGKKIPDAYVEMDLTQTDISYYTPIFSFFQYFSFKILHQNLGVLPEIASYHIPTLLLSSIGLFFLIHLLSEKFSIITALIAALFLSTFPFFIGHSHYGLKDVPVAIFLMLEMFYFLKFLEKRNMKFALFCGIISGIGFNLRITILLAIPVMALWLIIYFLKKKISFKEVGIASLIFFITFISFIILTNPIFWFNPFGIIKKVQYFSTFGWGSALYMGKIYNTLPWHYPFISLFIVTPPAVLLFFSLGSIVGFLERNIKILYIFSWWLVPLLIISTPLVNEHNGIRHFQFATIPIVSISSIGFVYILRKIKNARLQAVLFILLFVNFILLIYTLIGIHPYESTYFNFLVGGTGGPYKRFYIDDYGTSMSEGCIWVNDNLPPDSVLVAPQSMGALEQCLEEWVTVNYSLSFEELADLPIEEIRGDYLIYSTNLLAEQNTFDSIDALYEVRVDSAPLLRIIKIS